LYKPEQAIGPIRELKKKTWNCRSMKVRILSLGVLTSKSFRTVWGEEVKYYIY
jgi:hypothetical protein